MGLSTFDERAVYSVARLVVPADGTSLLPLVPAQTTDIRIDSILIGNRDGISHTVSLLATIGGVVAKVGSLVIPAGQGTNGTPCLDLMAGVLPAAQVGWTLKPGDLLGVQLSVAVAATFDVPIQALGGTF
jgi:hypothetical protein